MHTLQPGREDRFLTKCTVTAFGQKGNQVWVEGKYPVDKGGLGPVLM